MCDEDQRDLITQIRTVYGTNTVAQYDYTNDELGRRTAVGNSGSAFNVVGPQHERYGYNTRSELTAADRYFGSSLASTNDPMGTRSFAYNYDNIGNRLTASRNGIANAYTANALNQYTQRGQTGLVWLAGTAATNAVVTVNEQAVTRQGEYFHKALTVSNRTVAVFEPVEIVGVYNPPGTNAPDVVTIASGKVFAAKTPELFTYDADGNLLSDGRFAYSWDCENRMISAQTLTNLPATVPRVKLEFAYDYMGRRIKKTVSVSTNSSASYFITQTSTFVYDGWNMISEHLTSNASHLTNSYVWGLDLSGSLQGAGGIGGLLCASSGTGSAKRLYSYDANGNVGALLEADGTMVAHYEYDPYGKALVADGPAAKANPYRFSTKYSDDETSLYYYGYRYYSAETGRWVNRDPIEERGGRNLYAICKNRIVGRVDPLGLQANTCSVASAQLNGSIDANSVSNYGAYPGQYLSTVNVIIIIVGPGQNGGGEDGEITPPGGVNIGNYWLSMHSQVNNGTTCRKKNMCKGTCKNICCEWPREWQSGYLSGLVESDLVDSSAPNGGAYNNATCHVTDAEIAAGLLACKNSIPSCQ